MTAASITVPELLSSRGGFTPRRMEKKFDTGEGLRFWRAMRDLSQEELAAKVGCGQNFVSMLENGERDWSSDWLRRFATALQVTPNDLLTYTPAANVKEAAHVNIWRQLDEDDRDRATRLLSSLSQPEAGFVHQSQEVTPPPRRRRRRH